MYLFLSLAVSAFTCMVLLSSSGTREKHFPRPASVRRSIWGLTAHSSSFQQWPFCARLLALISVDLHLTAATLCLIQTQFHSLRVTEQSIITTVKYYGEIIIAGLTRVRNNAVSVCISVCALWAEAGSLALFCCNYHWGPTVQILPCWVTDELKIRNTHRHTHIDRKW